ncbi:MAG TPA: CsiV family protein [Gammaproteobacteria bacterium]|nr:CsiV family protein [Gammaproteobacteria bacterium]
MRHAASAVAAAALTALAAQATAQTASEAESEDRKTPYVVRYLVFQHQDFWDDPLRVAGPERDEPARKADQASPPAGETDPFDPLWQKLHESPRYRPLLQGSAVPFAVARDEAQPIAVEGSWPASIRPPFAALGDVADRPLRIALGGHWAPSAADGDRTTDRIRGTLTFYKGRYAHLAVKLAFTEQRRWLAWGIDRQHHFLIQSRRMLPNRYYYFDHPRFGVIARIEPMD